MAADLISIALCTYNGLAFLPEQMQSFLDQDYQNLEIVVVDDGSTDGTYELLKQYLKENSNIRLYQNPETLGFNRNFEKALGLCNGEFIAFADQDDIWDLNKISKLRANVHDNLLIYHDSEFIINGKLSGKKISDNHRFIKGKCEPYLLYDNCISGHACLISKKLLPHILPFPKNMYYDWWIGYTAANIGKLDFINQPLVKHRRHAASSTASDKITGKQKRIDNLRIFNEHKLNNKETNSLIKQMLKGYEELNEKAFSFKLFKLLLVNADTLFYTRRKSLYKKIRFIIEESTSR